jgi:prepilin-type N-terminal cleavage/methylation domain-containing protein
MKKTRFHKSGFTLVEIMIVVAIIGMLASIAIPNYWQARVKTQQTVCLNNLQQIAGAIERWSLETKRDQDQAVTYGDIRDYLKQSVVCPSGGSTFEDSYTITTVAAAPSCKRQPARHLLPP